jgi:hypothetical protein
VATLLDIADNRIDAHGQHNAAHTLRYGMGGLVRFF